MIKVRKVLLGHRVHKELRVILVRKEIKVEKRNRRSGPQGTKGDVVLKEPRELRDRKVLQEHEDQRDRKDQLGHKVRRVKGT